jgi:DNA-3-methyladenine glycosylase I
VKHQRTLNKSGDSKLRCFWCGDDEQYVAYHDLQWARPVVDDIALYEKICLEGFQAGLSWLTILRKRESFRKAFRGFDPKIVVKFNQRDVNRLIKDESIVRHRGKIEAAINNAQATLEVQKEFGSLATFIWGFRPKSTNTSKSKAPKRISDIKASTVESEALSKALRQRGFKFVGPTTMYAAMQSLGLVNDHFEGCFVREACAQQQFIAAKKMAKNAHGNHA